MKSKTVTILSICSALLLVTGLGYYFLLNQIYKIEGETEILKQEIQSFEAQNNELEGLQKNLKTTFEERDKILSVFIPEEGIVDFLELIEGIANGENVSIETNSVSKKDSGSLSDANKEIVSLDLSVEGKWDNVIKFLSLLEVIPFKSSIEKAVIENILLAGSSATSTPSSMWQADIIFNAVKAKEDMGIKKEEVKAPIVDAPGKDLEE